MGSHSVYVGLQYIQSVKHWTSYVDVVEQQQHIRNSTRLDFTWITATDRKRLAICLFNPLTPNGHSSGRTAPLTSRRCIKIFYQQIFVLNILNMLHNLRFSLVKMPFISSCYLVWFLYYSYFKYRVC
jgi:hypothetical protein